MSWFTKKGPARPAAPAPLEREAPINVKGFERLNPDPRYGKAFSSWNADNAEYAYIPAEGHLPFVDLAPKFVELLKLCWERASANRNAPRGPVQIGVNAPPTRPLPNANPALGRGAGARPDHLAGKAAPAYQRILGPLEYHSLVTDFKLTEKLERVNAYTFRGDRSRSPLAIEADNGFHPPITRTDPYYVENIIHARFDRYMQSRFNQRVTLEEFKRAYNRTITTPQERLLVKCYAEWWNLVERESHHLGQMVKCEDLKNYISSSRYLGIAMAFANASDAWVYVLRIRGGFNLRGSHRYNTKPNEQEIAFPGSVPWDEVFAFRRATQGKGRGLLTGPVYLRKTFEAVNPAAYKEVFEILSGKPQKPA